MKLALKIEENVKKISVTFNDTTFNFKLLI